VVRRNVRHLMQVFEKLSGLVSEGELESAAMNANAVVDDVAAEQLYAEGVDKRLQLEAVRNPTPLLARIDAAQFRRAVAYLIWYLTHHSAGEEAKVIISVGRHADKDGREEVRILIGSRTASVPAEKLVRLFDPVLMVQESLIDVGPAVSQRLMRPWAAGSACGRAGTS
jgi:hypothetical protein